jgi:hypothetical protein
MSPQRRLPNFHLLSEKGAMKYAVSTKAGARNHSASVPDLLGCIAAGTALDGDAE